MEDLNKTINQVVEEVKNFKSGNDTKMEALEKKNADLEQKNADFAKEIEELKKENLENARKISEFSVKAESSNDNEEHAIEMKYLSDFDNILRNFARGNREIKSECLENAEKLAHILAKKQGFGNAELEQKFVKSSMPEDKNSFPILEVKLNTFTGSEGGFAISNPKRLPAYRPYGERTSLYSLVEKVSTSNNTAEVLAVREGEDGFWEGEMGSDKTNSINFGKISIGTSIVKGVVPLTRTFVEDFDGNLYSFLYPLMEEKLNNAIERVLFTGDGAFNKPKGLAQYGELGANEEYDLNKFRTVSVNSMADFVDGLVQYSIINKAAKKDIMVHPTTLAAMLLLKDKQDRPLVQPNLLMDGARYMIAGMNIYVSDFCPDFSISGNKFAFMGDFRRAYTVVERTGKTVEFTPYENNNETIKYMLRQRVGGGVKGFDSLVVFKKA